MKNRRTIIFLSIVLLLLVVIAVLLVKLIKAKQGYPATETTSFAADAEQTQANGKKETDGTAENRIMESEDTSVPAITTAAPSETTTANISNADKKGDLTFASLPKYFIFRSGVGAWETELWLKDDGSFAGRYFDSDVGVHQYYYSIFNGQFAAPVRLNDYSYSLKIEKMETSSELNGGVADPEAEIIESEPYGIANTQELILYLPETSLTLLPEECISWMHLSESDTEVPSDMYVLYNAEEGYAFISVPN